MQQDIKICKNSLEETKNIFEIERKRYENSKAFDQPVRANMDSILYAHGIDKIGAFDSDIGGNYFHQLMYNAD